MVGMVGMGERLNVKQFAVIGQTVFVKYFVWRFCPEPENAVGGEPPAKRLAIFYLHVTALSPAGGLVSDKDIKCFSINTIFAQEKQNPS